MEILRAAFPASATPRERTRAAVAIAEIRGNGIPQIAPGASGTGASGRCGVAFATVAGQRIPLRISASRRAIESGEPLRVSGCGSVDLPKGPVRLITAGDLFKVNLLRLRSPAPDPRTAPIAPGRVLDEGQSHRGGARDGVQLDLRAPATLVLGQSYSKGWRAWCDGRSLGEPRVVDGYANGWDVKPPCANVRFAFGPDHAVRVIQLGSGIACLLLLLLVIWPRGRAEWSPNRALARSSDRSVRPATIRRSVVLGLLAAAVFGFCFSLRAGVLVFVGVTLIVRLGIGPRVLALAAGLLLAVVVPAVYLLFPATDRGGYNPGYAGEHVGAHWVAVAGYALLVVALLQTLSRARDRGAGAARSTP